MQLNLLQPPNSLAQGNPYSLYSMKFQAWDRLQTLRMIPEELAPLIEKIIDEIIDAFEEVRQYTMDVLRSELNNEKEYLHVQLEEANIELEAEKTKYDDLKFKVDEFIRGVATS